MSSNLKEAINNGNNIIIVDPKGDMSMVSRQLLEERGYKICPLMM